MPPTPMRVVLSPERAAPPGTPWALYTGVSGTRRGVYPRLLLCSALTGCWWPLVVGRLYGGWDPLGEGGDDVVAPAYLFNSFFQLPLEERYVVAEVSDDLVFGFQ